jgi:DNA-directed RNA polymerase specialized sigma24 family protein
VETREYVEYLLKNYNEILKDIEQLKFEYEAFKDIASDEVIESLSFSSSNDERVTTSNISDKTCKISLIYKEVAKRMNKESRDEIYKMMKATEFEITRLNYCIDRLETKIKEVIKDIFIEKLSWSEACEKCSISEKTLNKYKNKGIDKITSMFDLGRLVS